MSDVRDPERDQVEPVPNDGPSCHELVRTDLYDRKGVIFHKYDEMVRADLLERKEHGLSKYQSLLQPFNGRSFALDAYEEILDLLAYMRGMIEEDKVNNPRFPNENLLHHYKLTLNTAVFLRRELELERLKAREG